MRGTLRYLLEFDLLYRLKAGDAGGEGNNLRADSLGQVRPPLRCSFEVKTVVRLHYQPEAQNAKFQVIHKPAGRPISSF
jgi:hypothetical protein